MTSDEKDTALKLLRKMVKSGHQTLEEVEKDTELGNKLLESFWKLVNGTMIPKGK